MIGNSNDTMRIAKHFKKMFAGLSGLVMDEEGIISGFTSKEGEVVRLKKEINLVKDARINDWLALLENGMKATLAELLAEAVNALHAHLLQRRSSDKAALSSLHGGLPKSGCCLGHAGRLDDRCRPGSGQGGAAPCAALYDREVQVLRLLADTVLGDLETLLRGRSASS